MDQIRHTFLHYEMDPLAEKHYSSIKRLEPLLVSVKRAPIEEAVQDRHLAVGDGVPGAGDRDSNLGK